jgi:hypothetical protein
MKKLLSYLSGSLAVFGGGVFFIQTFLFSEYAKSGSLKPDKIHSVLINNHGDYSYITLAQSDCLHLLLVWSVSLVLLAIVIDVINRKFVTIHRK